MVCFHTPISLIKLYVSVRGNQPTLNNLKYIQSQGFRFRPDAGRNVRSFDM